MTRRVALCIAVLPGLALRGSGLAEPGFAEDEINKLEAVELYARGDITPNAEHPMLMKSLIYVSLKAGSTKRRAPPTLFSNAGAPITRTAIKIDETRRRGVKVYEGFVNGLSAVEVYEVK